MTLRPHTVVPLVESMFALDGGAMFGIIPRTLWDRTNPADDQHRIDLACRCLLVQYEDRNVLVDVGMGNRWTDKERHIYKINAQDIALNAALAVHGLTPDDIHDVVLTHLHFDHAGGVAKQGADGAVAPSFPRAIHWVQRKNWGWANSPSARDGGSYRKEDLAVFEGPDAPELRLVDGPSEILPGIEVFPQNGHTFGMQIVKVSTPNATYVHLADLIPTSSHLRDPYVMGYDLQPLVTLEEKREVLYHAAREDWFLVFEHDPLVAMSRVEFDGAGRPRLAK
ncbi:MAG: MBL fold metallo-hydrolase [bacterium]